MEDDSLTFPDLDESPRTEADLQYEQETQQYWEFSPMTSPIQPEEAPKSPVIPPLLPLDSLTTPEPSAADSMDQFDKFLVENIKKMDQFRFESKVGMFRSMIREGGTLTNESDDSFCERFEKHFKGLPNGTRKKKIRKLLREHPSLLSVDRDIMWKRVNYYLELYGSKE